MFKKVGTLSGPSGEPQKRPFAADQRQELLQFGPEFAAGQREPERMIKRAALAPGGGGHSSRPDIPGAFVIGLLRQKLRRLGRERSILDHGRDRAFYQRPQFGK